MYIYTYTNYANYATQKTYYKCMRVASACNVKAHLYE